MDDYPLLPVRRRFWEHVLRAVDVQGTAANFARNSTSCMKPSGRLAETPLGTVVPADCVFDQLHADLLRGGIPAPRD